jgi:Tfp pilus assembly protein PilZ
MPGNMAPPSEERRSGGALRIPFVRRCNVEFEEGATVSAFLVNINVLGAYLALDDMPRLGQRVVCRFRLPETEQEVTIGGVVAWTNPRQQHPVHSLPPGFGVGFRQLTDENRSRIEGIVREYLMRQTRGH